MESIQRLSNTTDDLHCLPGGEAPLIGEDVEQRGTGHIFHHQEGEALILSKVAHLDYSIMADEGGHPSLFEEVAAVLPFLILAHLIPHRGEVQEFHREELPQMEVFSQIDGTQAPLTQAPDEVISIPHDAAKEGVAALGLMSQDLREGGAVSLTLLSSVTIEASTFRTDPHSGRILSLNRACTVVL